MENQTPIPGSVFSRNGRYYVWFCNDMGNIEIYLVLEAGGVGGVKYRAAGGRVDICRSATRSALY